MSSTWQPPWPSDQTLSIRQRPRMFPVAPPSPSYTRPRRTHGFLPSPLEGRGPLLRQRSCRGLSVSARCEAALCRRKGGTPPSKQGRHEAHEGNTEITKEIPARSARQSPLGALRAFLCALRVPLFGCFSR